MEPSYEQAAEEFLRRVIREYYENGAGIKETIEIVAVYNQFGWLFDRSAVDSSLVWSTPAERAIADFVVDGYLDASVKELSEKITNEMTQATIEWQGEHIPYRRASVIIANEPDQAKRHELESRARAETEKHNPEELIRWQTLHSQVRDIGFASYLDMAEQLKSFRLEWLLARMIDLRERTEEIYVSELEHFLGTIGVDSADATSGDIAFLFRSPQFDRLFPPEKLIPTLRATLAGLGVDLDSQKNVILDTESRPLKSPRAFCAPVRIPDEVFLVISPRGGRDDYASIMHEAGHAEHFAWTDPTLSFAEKRLGDISVSESYAFLFDNLLKNSRWMSEVMGEHDHADYCRLARFHKLYMLRRYSGKLEYETKLHTSGDIESMRDTYAETLSRALHIKISPVNYLTDVDDGLYAAGYIRAWIFEVMLRRHLEENFGLLWFKNPDAGKFIAGLWSLGRRHTVDELAHYLRYEHLDAEPLVTELAR